MNSAQKRKLVVTTFYSNGKAIWTCERPFQMSDEEIKRTIAQVNKMDYGTVDAYSDTTGRLVNLPKAIESNE